MNNSDESSDDIVKKDILTLLGADSLSEEEKAKLYEKMLETIRYRVIEKITLALSKDDLDKWDSLIGDKKEKEATDFLTEKGIDLIKLMADEAMLYKTEVVTYADFIKSSGKSLSEITNEQKKDSPKE